MTGIYVSTSANETVKLWEQQQLYRDVIKQTRLKNFISKDGTNIVHDKSITGKKGDNVTFALRYRTNNGFLPSRTLIRGNEGNIDTATDSVTIDDKNLGLITGVDIDRQRSMYDMPAETRMALIEDCLVIFKKLLTVKKYGVANARYVIRKSKATIGPPLSKIFLITSAPIETK